MTEANAKKQTAERDSGIYSVPQCQWYNGCGKIADDPAHILPKGRFPEIRADEKNIIWLCREHHQDGESYEAWVELLRHMVFIYGYEYDEEPYLGYRGE